MVTETGTVLVTEGPPACRTVTVTGYVPSGVPAGAETCSGTTWVAGSVSDTAVKEAFAGSTVSGSAAATVTEPETVPGPDSTADRSTSVALAPARMPGAAGAAPAAVCRRVSGTWSRAGGAAEAAVPHDEGDEPTVSARSLPALMSPVVRYVSRSGLPPSDADWMYRSVSLLPGAVMVSRPFG